MQDSVPLVSEYDHARMLEPVPSQAVRPLPQSTQHPVDEPELEHFFSSANLSIALFLLVDWDSGG